MKPPATVGEALALAQGRIPRSEARLLLREASGLSAAAIAAFPERALEQAAAARFGDWLLRREVGEPVAYILGEREFFGRRFRVQADVLIPRPDTELIVEQSLRFSREWSMPRVLDLGTGSGAIAVSIALECPAAAVVAVDASEVALRVAQENARELGARLDFRLGCWFEPVAGERFEVIASNPPYIAAADAHLEQGDLRFEPRSALASGDDGLDDIRHIVATAPQYLAERACLLIEHGFEQGPAVRALLIAQGFQEVETCRDLAGHERVSLGRWN
ncbi:peptide chain release factor N(5)-glutamine methyltransferase [Niveibacterium sp. SC-1]|uniref:peptide chain release factor N(5)-glutamine methyltransferase n=1 Tax=Niveibacterium sp. SC-1 TaxID=3135646 RepID=UPI00311DB727